MQKKKKEQSLAFAATVALTKAPKLLAPKVQLRFSLWAAAAAVKVGLRADSGGGGGDARPSVHAWLSGGCGSCSPLIPQTSPLEKP